MGDKTWFHYLTKFSSITSEFGLIIQSLSHKSLCVACRCHQCALIRLLLYTVVFCSSIRIEGVWNQFTTWNSWWDIESFVRACWQTPTKKWNKKNFGVKNNLLKHVIQHCFRKPLLAVFQNNVLYSKCILLSIWSTFLRSFLRNQSAWENWRTCASHWWLAASPWTADPIEPISVPGKASSCKAPSPGCIAGDAWVRDHVIRSTP